MRGGAQEQPDAVGVRHPHIEVLRARVVAAAPEIAILGEWPGYIDDAALADRVPIEGEYAAGFDAGIACALGLIPADKQRLAACLHAAYTPMAVHQVCGQSDPLDADSETCWWLAACSVCQEGGITVEGFHEQLERFEILRSDPEARLTAAKAELAGMKSRFRIRDGWAYTEEDGGMQGAYISGHPVAISFNPDEQLYFIGTYLPSLGLEDFSFSNELDDKGRPRSGPVHGSRQYVRCTDQAELQAALRFIDEQLS